MHVLALATDYDGTLANRGRVDPSTLVALKRFKAAGRRLVLVTGRQLPELRALMPELAVFDRVVAENGALLFDPATGDERCLTSPPSRRLVELLRSRGVDRLALGRSIIATWEPHQAAVLAAIRELGFELSMVFNKGAIMVLPTGVNKATGLAAALRELDIAPHSVVGVGDAENDHSFLQACGHAAVVANALPALRAEADTVLTADHGAGVERLIERCLSEDESVTTAPRHGLELGYDREGAPVRLLPDGGHVLIVGPSRCGKSTLGTALTERMFDLGYEFWILDPEGDYRTLRHGVPVGSTDDPPEPQHLYDLLNEAAINAVVELRSMPLHARRILAESLWLKLVAQRARTGRPAWMLIDEAHQTFPRGSDAHIPNDAPTTLLITLDPSALSRAVLAQIRTVIALGSDPDDVIDGFCRAAALSSPSIRPEPAAGEALVWRPRSAQPPVAAVVRAPAQPHRRHAGKYAVGDVGLARSFWFRGSAARINVPARNLFEFIQLGTALGDEVWDHHLRAGDFGRWFRGVIRDEELATRVDSLAAARHLSAAQTRAILQREILTRYQPSS